MRTRTVALLAGVLAVSALAMPVKADDAYKGFQAGDIMIRGRGLMVLPTVESSVSGIGGHVDASTSFEPEADISYFLTPNISAELIAAITRHQVTDKGSSLGDVNLGHTTLLPPTLTAQYHFMPSSAFSPYLGAGVNYTVFFDTKTTAGSAATSVKYENNWGAALQAGADYHVVGNWYANVDIKHIFLSTTAKINNNAIIGSVNLDPTILGIGVGYKF